MFKPLTLGILSLVVLCPALTWAQTQNHKGDEEGKLNFSMGGGLSVPVNPTANFSGVGGNFVTGGGYNLDQHNSVIGQFMWAGLPPAALPPSQSAVAQLVGLSPSINLFSITANYRYRANFGSTFGYYLIAGGGWYERRSSVSKETFVPTGTVCQPVWFWYGYTCTDGFVNTRSFGLGTSSFGGNGGVGLTIKAKGGWKFFLESRYTYAASRDIPTKVIPVTFGFVYQ